MSVCPFCPPPTVKIREPKKEKEKKTRHAAQLAQGNRRHQRLPGRTHVHGRVRGLSIDVVFLGKQAQYEFHPAICSDICGKHWLLQESSCSNTGFVCKITYSSFWRNVTVCVCVAAQHQFYSSLKAVKGLLMMVMFAHRELLDAGAVTHTAHWRRIRIIKAHFSIEVPRWGITPKSALYLPLSKPLSTNGQKRWNAINVLYFHHSGASFREGNESCFWKVIIMA